MRVAGGRTTTHHLCFRLDFGCAFAVVCACVKRKIYMVNYSQMRSVLRIGASSLDGVEHEGSACVCAGISNFL